MIGHNISNIRCSDDTVLVAYIKKDRYNFMDTVVVHNEQLGLD